MELGASAEDVDLYLDAELFFDFRTETGEWVEAESLDVDRRFVKLRYSIGGQVCEEWVNVDTDFRRFAELHSKTGAEAQMARAADIAAQAEEQQARLQNARELYEEVIIRTEQRLREWLTAQGDSWVLSAIALRQAEAASRPPPSAPSSSAAAAAAAASGSSSSFQLSRSHSDPLGAPASSAVASSDLAIVSSSAVKVPLFDSQSHLRISLPAYAPTCSHPETFDLWTHLVHRLELERSQPVWQCPLCCKEAWAADLLIDPLLLHILRIVGDGSLDRAHCGSAASNGTHSWAAGMLTPSSPLLSVDACLQSLGTLSQLLAFSRAKAPLPATPFEERRLTIFSNGVGLEPRLSISTESEDARLRDRRLATRRARTLPSSRSNPGNSGSQMDDEDIPISVLMQGESPLKKPRLEDSAPPPLVSPTSPISVAASSSAAAAAAAASANGVHAPSVPASSSVAALPFPSWLDAEGRFWFDLTGDEPAPEGEAFWQGIRVKIEQQHASFTQMQEKCEQQYMQPPSMPPPQLPPFLVPAAAAGFPVPYLVTAAAAMPAVAAAAGGAAGLSAPSGICLSRASTLPAAASPPRAAPVPRPAQSPICAQSSTSPAKPKPKHAPPSASTAAPATADAAAPKVSLNRCSASELSSIPGLGHKLVERILAERLQAWMIAKVEFNDRAREMTQSTGVPTPECECEIAEQCAHVAAFTRWKDLKEIDGVGKKMLQKLQQHCKLEL